MDKPTDAVPKLKRGALSEENQYQLARFLETIREKHPEVDDPDFYDRTYPDYEAALAPYEKRGWTDSDEELPELLNDLSSFRELLQEITCTLPYSHPLYKKAMDARITFDFLVSSLKGYDGQTTGNDVARYLGRNNP